MTLSPATMLSFSLLTAGRYAIRVDGIRDAENVCDVLSEPVFEQETCLQSSRCSC